MYPPSATSDLHELCLSHFPFSLRAQLGSLVRFRLQSRKALEKNIIW